MKTFVIKSPSGECFSIFAQTKFEAIARASGLDYGKYPLSNYIVLKQIKNFKWMDYLKVPSIA
jgi:hypothetical protein